jgi:predicted  nucleic acid-binding Zn-ribbon protein
MPDDSPAAAEFFTRHEGLSKQMSFMGVEDIMPAKKNGSVKRPFEFKGNVQAKGEFEVAYEVTEDQGIGVASQLTEAVNAFLDQRLKTLTAAVQDLDGKLEKLLNESKKLSDASNGKEAKAKADEASKLYASVHPVLQSFITGTQADGQKFLSSWWAEAQAKDSKLKTYNVKAAFKATATITASAIGAAAGIASAVVTAGAATPIALAALGGAVTVASTSFTALKAAFEGFDSAYDKLDQAYVQAQKDLKRLAIKSQKPDKGMLDKIKAFLASSPVKALESALGVYQVKVREAEAKLASYGNEVGKLMKQRDALQSAASTSKNDDVQAQAKKIWDRVEYLYKKIEGLRSRMDDAKKIASEANKLVADAQAGKLEGLGGKMLGKLESAAPFLQDGATAIEGIKTLVQVGMQAAA